MGICSSSSSHTLHILNKATAEDYDTTLPVFTVLKLRDHVATKFLQLYEASCDQGKGSIEYLHHSLRINKNDHYFFDKTFLYFQDGGHDQFSFTCPQFCVMLWQFLSQTPDDLAAWMFRVYFGGDTCAHHLYATQDEVFKVLDVLYGVSKTHDYRPGSEYLDVAYKTGNSHSYDVKRAKILVKSIAVLPTEIEDDKADKVRTKKEIEAHKVIGILQFQALVKKAPDLIRRIFAVQDFARHVCGGVKMWKAAAALRTRNEHEELEMVIERMLEENENVFKHGNKTKSRRNSFSNEKVVRARRNSFKVKRNSFINSGNLFSQNKNTSAKTKNNFSGSSNYVVNVDSDDEQDDADQLPSIYHHLDFGNLGSDGQYTAKKKIKRRKSYVAKVGDPEYTGPVNAEDYHQKAAITLQKRSRGMVTRMRAKNMHAKHKNEVEDAKRRAKERQKR